MPTSVNSKLTSKRAPSRPPTGISGDILKLDEQLAQMLADRRRALQEQQQLHVVEYVPRVAKYQRPLSQGERARPRSKISHVRRPRSPPAEPLSPSQQAARRRKDLSDSFQAVKDASAYQTVFPALLGPLRRKVPDVAPIETKTRNTSPQCDQSGSITSLSLSGSVNSFSVLRATSTSPRERPASGPSPFYPTGSQAAVNRAFNRM